MKKYNTQQRQRLLAFLKEHRDRQHTVEEIAACLCGGESVSLSAIYRNINGMVMEGLVGRFTAEGSRMFLYQYIGEDECSGHLHLKCDRCGQIFHIDDLTTEQLLTTAITLNEFHVDKKKTVLYGSCKDCKI